jgi:hypothetical protein
MFGFKTSTNEPTPDGQGDAFLCNSFSGLGSNAMRENDAFQLG